MNVILSHCRRTSVEARAKNADTSEDNTSRSPRYKLSFLVVQTDQTFEVQPLPKLGNFSVSIFTTRSCPEYVVAAHSILQQPIHCSCFVRTKRKIDGSESKFENKIFFFCLQRVETQSERIAYTGATSLHGPHHVA